MNTAKLLLMVGGVVIVTSCAYFLLSPYAKTVEDFENTADSSDSNFERRGITEGAFAPQFPADEVAEVEAVAKDKKVVTEVVPTSTVAVVSKPVVTPTPVQKPVPAVSGYTATQVAMHGGEASCWSIINGGVYDLTSFVSKHPGGDRNILKICGKDGTLAFTGQHGGDEKPESTLGKYYLGKLEP